MSFLDYAPAPESTAILNLQKSYGLFIGGEFVDGHGSSFATISPSTEKAITSVAEATEADIDKAVAAARKAYDKTWSRMSGSERGKYLSASLESSRSARGNLPLPSPSTTENLSVRPGTSTFLLLQPGSSTTRGGPTSSSMQGLGPNPKALGVAAQIIPWNFPLLMLAWKIAPALAAGNTVVLKPAQTTPLTALLFAEICQQAELPPGVVNIVTGAGNTGAALVAHPDINKVAFTGSTPWVAGLPKRSPDHPPRSPWSLAARSKHHF